MCVLGNPGREYFSKFNLPKNYVDYFDSVKIKGIDKFDKLINEDGYYDQTESKNAADLILKMLDFNIDKRLSAEQCLKHPFLAGKKMENGKDNVIIKNTANGQENIIQ